MTAENRFPPAVPYFLTDIVRSGLPHARFFPMSQAVVAGDKIDLLGLRKANRGPQAQDIGFMGIEPGPDPVQR